MNGWMRFLLGLLAALILGAYGFAYQHSLVVATAVERRLERMENKLDRLEVLIGGSWRLER